MLFSEIWVDPKDCHIKLCKSEREKQISRYRIYKNDTNVLIYKAKNSHRFRK